MSNEDYEAAAENPRYAPRHAPTYDAPGKLPPPVPLARYDDEPLYQLLVNDEWVSHLLGVIQTLDEPDAWSGSDADITDAREQVAEIMAALMEAYEPVNPFIVGEIRVFAFSPPPSGWLACDGTLKSRTTYADLFAAIGTHYGAGDGSTTFKLPDALGRVPVGAGSGSGLTTRALGDSSGEQTHQLIASEMPAHTHTVVMSTGGLGNGGGTNVRQPSGSTTTSSAGGDGFHNNMQPYFVVQYAIYAGV